MRKIIPARLQPSRVTRAALARVRSAVLRADGHALASRYAARCTDTATRSRASSHLRSRRRNTPAIPPFSWGSAETLSLLFRRSRTHAGSQSSVRYNREFYGVAPLQHSFRRYRRVPPVRERHGALLCLRTHSLRLRPHRQFPHLRRRGPSPPFSAF